MRRSTHVCHQSGSYDIALARPNLRSAETTHDAARPAMGIGNKARNLAFT